MQALFPLHWPSVFPLRWASFFPLRWASARAVVFRQARVKVPADGDWCVYLLHCADGSLYTGITRDVARRLRQHNGEIVGGSRYTRSRRPVSIAWSTRVICRSEAQRLEASIKSLAPERKWALIRR